MGRLVTVDPFAGDCSLHVTVASALCGKASAAKTTAAESAMKTRPLSFWLPQSEYVRVRMRFFTSFAPISIEKEAFPAAREQPIELTGC
jgi:hypothetical protein